MTYQEVIAALQAEANPKNVAGMARFGINPQNTLGISIPVLRGLARKIGKNHELALQLWQSGIHEARLLAAFIDIPAEVSEAQMDAWTADFDSWDVCDQVCANLYDRTPFAHAKAQEWATKEAEFVRRAGFAMMAVLAVHDKKASDSQFEPFFDLIEKYASDERNFVKKAVNWALRQIGKRNVTLGEKAMKLSEKLSISEYPAARWVGKDALRELKAKSY